MNQHTSTLWLPDALRSEGINVVELDGWKEAQGLYFWTRPEEGTIGDYDEPPKCYMIHHTAGSAASPCVKDLAGRWSKANCWAGLLRGTRLYQEGGGIPTIVFTSAGPARVSAGYGHWPTALEVFDGVRVPWRQTNPDGPFALNRYAWSVETVALGDGSPIDPGVEYALIVMGTLLCEHYDWSPWNTIGHVTWTRRKIDPVWNWESDRIVAIQNAVAELMIEEDDMTYESFRAAEFDLWSDDNVMDAWDRGRFQDTNRKGFLAYWTSMEYIDANGDSQTGTRSQRTPAEKARFMTDYYARL